MLVPTCAGLTGVSLTCWYLPVQVCPGWVWHVGTYLCRFARGCLWTRFLHLQSVRELASPVVSLLIGQLEHSEDPDLNVFLGQAENTRIIIIIIISSSSILVVNSAITYYTIELLEWSFTGSYQCDSEVHAIPIGEFGHLNSLQTGQWNGLFHTHVDLSEGFEHDSTLIGGCPTFLLTDRHFLSL